LLRQCPLVLVSVPRRWEDVRCNDGVASEFSSTYVVTARARDKTQILKINFCDVNVANCKLRSEKFYYKLQQFSNLLCKTAAKMDVCDECRPQMEISKYSSNKNTSLVFAVEYCEYSSTRGSPITTADTRYVCDVTVKLAGYIIMICTQKLSGSSWIDKEITDITSYDAIGYFILYSTPYIHRQ